MSRLVFTHTSYLMPLLSCAKTARGLAIWLLTIAETVTPAIFTQYRRDSPRNIPRQTLACQGQSASPPGRTHLKAVICGADILMRRHKPACGPPEKTRRGKAGYLS